jgi:hypothetical protein
MMIARFTPFAFALTLPWALTTSVLTAEPAGSAPANSVSISFKKSTLDRKFRSEGVAAGDFNHDGKLDIAAGSVYYAAPDWKMHVIDPKKADERLRNPGRGPVGQAREFDPEGYSNTFSNYAEDLSGDGWTDLIVVDWPGEQTWWWENPRDTGQPWKRHTCINSTCNESPWYVDLDGDGKRELVCSTQDKALGNHYVFAKPNRDPYRPWDVTKISALLKDRQAEWTGQYYHGLGVGDVNRDGRLDVIIPHGWWEAAAATASTDPSAPWKFHGASFGPPAAHMYSYDFDGDADNDVLSSSAHKYGIWWHEQTSDGWKMHEIDKSFSESHSMCLADINGDGLPDFLTGKRWYSHARAEPGADMPAVLKWFQLGRKDGKPVWTPHQIDDDSGVGTQFEVIDMNGDKLLDVIVANKKGVFYFQQERKAK